MQISIPSLMMGHRSDMTAENMIASAPSKHSEQSLVEDDTTVSTRTAESKLILDTESSLSSAQDDDDITASHDEATEETEAVVDVETQFARMVVKKAVRFSTIQIKEYPIIVGDNPSVCRGVPITIDWTPLSEMQCSVDDYEEQRPKPRSTTELCMPSSRRADLLIRLGFSRQEVNKGTKAANIVRGRRRRTQETMKLSSGHETLERITRATLNATLRRGKKSKERVFLKRSGVSASSRR